MNEHEFHVACAILDDQRKLIAAGKSQRWDVIKWAVTINVALATASIALQEHEHENAAKWLFGLAVIVAAIACGLMLHYNNRMKNTRNDSVAPEDYLAHNDVDIVAITGKRSERVNWLYDWQELGIFTAILVFSVFPTLVVWMVLGH
jgi:hypothetical protein